MWKEIINGGQKDLLEGSEKGFIEIQRSFLIDQFFCCCATFRHFFLFKPAKKIAETLISSAKNYRQVPPSLLQFFDWFIPLFRPCLLLELKEKGKGI